MDLLSGILQQARWTNHMLLRKTIRGSWGFRFPCDRSGGFHVITLGSCYLVHDEEEVKLEKGDLVFVMRGVPHDLVSEPGQKVLDISKFSEASMRTRNGPVVQITSMRYEFPDGDAHSFFRELPPIVLVRGSEIPPHHPLQTALSLLSAEQGNENGSALILERLTDIMLFYALRHWLGSHPARQPGFRSAMLDEKISSVLDSVHRKPAHAWTLDGLARMVGMSRASLASRFRGAMGMTVMDYVARLRLDAGRVLLEDESMTLEDAAQAVGYSSAFAFSKAFKRVFGRSPRSPLPANSSRYKLTAVR
ncbi:MAG TPA: AraC family transcriptional regulator [Leptospiraceae bacterium]|nr:AraC family transcriptional regulator [Leptospirales bacterium]HMU84441.1 AraC family transcriptional regulator [Leptospiraceae bacterium]HMW59025.1 AraC family transcriptional regulator [Leptospiraceae bacterium]HMX55119.1 AraC family transcriptional regulator [Leptospiraceae bacterium]HMZ36446.1 AraC family transcriptional regulator [Leptospiraceae bacterium]